MKNIVFFDNKTMKVVNDEVGLLFEEKKRNPGSISNIEMVDARYVVIENGYIVKRFTKEEVEAQEQARQDAEDARFFEMLSKRTEEKRFEQFEPIVQPIQRTNPVRQASVSPQKKSVPRTHRKKTLGYRIKVIIANIAKEQARKKSFPGQTYSFKRSRSNKQTIRQTIAVGAVVAILGLSAAAGYGLSDLNNYMQYMSSHNSVSSSTATLLDSTPEGYSQDIVDRNTGYNHISQKYWYNDEDIAEDVLELPDESFDANLYLVYALMGANADNGYDNHFDDVIDYIGDHADKENQPNAYLRCHGCSSLEEFLVKNGMVDEKGMPSIELYKKHGRTATITHKDFLENAAEEYENEYHESKGGR